MGHLRILRRHEYCDHLPHGLVSLSGNQAAVSGRCKCREQVPYADLQLDLVFAIANAEGRSPVKVSADGNLPKAGSLEAEQILGRAPTLQARGSDHAGSEIPGPKGHVNPRTKDSDHVENSA